MRNLVIPTVFAISREEFNKRFDKLRTITRYVHIDIMDGQFVPAKSIAISSLPILSNYDNLFEAHLMVVSPEKYIDSLKTKGFRKVIVHYESFENDRRRFLALEAFNRARLFPFMALNPETPVEAVLPFRDHIKGVMLMGVEPGAEGQKIISGIYEKVRELKRLDPRIIIQIDGGISVGTAGLLKKAGADIINTGSFVGDAEDSKEALRALQSVFLAS